MLLGNNSGNSQFAEALVYVSRDFTKHGQPKDEYVDRMNAGIIDARKLGMSETYIENCLRLYIPNRAPRSEAPDDQNHRHGRLHPVGSGPSRNPRQSKHKAVTIRIPGW